MKTVKRLYFREQAARIAMTLMIMLVTSTAWGGYQFPQSPIGCIDGVEGGRLAVRVSGWTCDPYYENSDKKEPFEAVLHPEMWNRHISDKQWYLAERNKAEIHLLKDGKEVKCVEVNTNITRNDVVASYGFYTSERHYYDPTEEWWKTLDPRMGFDTWIEVNDPGTYHVVVYGTNVHGYEDKAKLYGERDVTVLSGYTITFDPNTSEQVFTMPKTKYKSQLSGYTYSYYTEGYPGRSGYTFKCWNTEPDGSGICYDSGDTYSTNADVTLYAQWVRSSFSSFWGWCKTTISSVDDWNDLATMVNNGLIHGKTITLVNDIGDENNPITRCIGTRLHPFDNNFNGNGHSIYVDINDTSQEGTAPFRYMGVLPSKWADWGSWQICRLKVKGTVRGGKYCSGLVGISQGVDAFLCAVQTDVITNSTHCAGVIGYVDGTRQNDKTNTTCSVFSGSISGATQSTGIFIGARKNGRESSCNYCLSTGTVSGANIDLAPPSEVTHSFKTTDHGKQGTYIPYDPPAIIREMVGLKIENDRSYYWCLDHDGSILPFHQVYIDDAAHWDAIATLIANGASFGDRELVLNSDITVSTMLGTAEHPFDGSFDGQNKTLTFNLTTDESGCAPFRYIKRAYIHNLNIDGILEHSVGAKTCLAGVAAYTSGNNFLNNLTVNSTIRSQASSYHHAGLVAQVNDGLMVIQNCTFKGELLCDANSSGCGGLVALNMSDSTIFINCLFAPKACTVGTDQSCTISRDIKKPSVIRATYYTQELGQLQGSRVYTKATAPDNVFSSLWTGPDKVDYYMPVPTYIDGLQHTYNYNEGKPIDIDYSFYCYQYPQDAEKYTATIRKTTDNTEVTKVTDIGSYALSITANEGSGYYGTVEQPFYVTASSLAMNDKGHFLINSTDDWNTLCELSSDAHQEEYEYFEDRVVELTADITVNQQLGIFRGTLAGNGHTLTLDLGTVQNPFTRDGAAPIYSLRGNAVVENLYVDGTIITSQRFAGGIAGETRDNVRINNCRSSIRVKTTYNGECYNGGLVGLANDGKLAINNSLFDGCFTSENNTATHWAGFVGRVNTYEVSINSCLYFANRHEMQVPAENNATFYLPTNIPVALQNCCHTEQHWAYQQGTYVANNLEATPQMAALGYEGWDIVFGYPQWQDYYQEGQEWPLVLPRTDYRTAVAGHIDDLQGNGTAAAPYLIGSAQDWNVFAASINNNVGAEAYYQLTDDITIDQGHLVGTTVPYTTVNLEYGERRTFRGTFDGNGHTLTLNMTTNGACAPFLYAQDCTIKDLTVKGSITTSGQHAAGLIVNAAGTVNITGCRSKLTISSSYSGESSYAGLVANSTGMTNIEDCVFSGNIIGTTFCVGNCNITNSFYTKPAQIGQGTALYSVTAAKGIDMSIGGDGVLKEYANGITMKGDGVLLDGVFYAPENVQVPIKTLQLITGYSPQNVTIAPNAGTYADGTLTMPAQNVVFGTSTPIALSTYTIRFDANGGTGEAMDDMNFTYGDDPKALTENTYTLTANSFTGWNTAADGSGTAYTDGQTVENLATVSGTTITLYAQWEPWILDGFGKTDSYMPDGTAEHPYVISTTEEWNLLCDYISSGKGDLASCHYRLSNSITVSRMMGTEANPFRGTFEGSQCTLTLDLTGTDPVEIESIVPTDSENSEDPNDPENPNDLETPDQQPQIIEIPDAPNNQAEAPEDNGLRALAPFAYVNGATIKNLRTTGTIHGESRFFAAGIVGKSEGNTTLQSCHTSVNITSTAAVAEGEEESPMLGGIVGQCSGSLSFTDCLFDGSINAENTSYCGGFLGQLKSGEVTFTNCLMDGELSCDLNGCGTFYQPDRDNNTSTDYTVTNSYYHTVYGASQGTQTDDTGEDLKSDLGESWAVTTEEAVVPFLNTHDLGYARLTLEYPAYPYTGSAITIGYTMNNYFGVTMAEGTDYTATILNAEGTEVTDVIECGPYTLIINGAGDYIGSKTAHFYVCKLDENGFPFQIDEDFNFEDAGYYYVTLPNYMENNPKIINIPEGFTHSFKVYDDGGKTRYDEWGNNIGYYGDSGTLQIVAPNGSVFNVMGSIKTLDTATLTIYDGTTLGSNRIFGPASGEQLVNLVTFENGIIFDFYVDDNMRDEGFDLTVTLGPQLPATDLADDDSSLEFSEKNVSVIAENNGEKLSIALDGRTLYRDGTWNTLCLPFDIPDIQSTLLRGATVKTLSSSEYENGMLTLNFSDNLTSMEAGKPYIVKWTDVPLMYTAYAGTRNSDSNEYYNVDFENILSEGDPWYLEEGKYSDEHPFCEIEISEPMAVTGYRMSSDDSPTKWTLKGKLNESDEWTLIDSREVIYTEENNYEDEDEVTYEGTTYTLAADKQGQYRFFRLDILEHDVDFNLWGFKIEGNVAPDNYVNPVFGNVTIKDELHPVAYKGVSFGGNYGTLSSTDGLLLDAHNAGGNAFHATLSLPDVTLYADAELTTLATNAAIPFAADGTVTFYYPQSDLELTLHDDDSQAAANEKNASLIAAKDGEFAVVTLDGHTLYRDGTWNTICLPFDLSDLKGTPLEGATVKAFTLGRTENNNGALTLNFTDVTPSDEQGNGGPLLGYREGLKAGKPYIVKWEPVVFPAVAPSKDLLAKLGFIDEIPTLYYPDPNDKRLLDGNTDSQYQSDYDPYIEFHYETPITPMGYAIWTANDGDGEYNPASWTIWAWNEGDEDATELANIDNSTGDKLPMANSTCTLFELDNSTAYQYFRFEGTTVEGNKVQLSELQFFTARPNTDNIVNPVFDGVTIKSQTAASDNIFFEGSYSTLDGTDGQMLDAHNDGGKAFHATLNLSSLNYDSYDFNCYSDAEHTTPVGSTIPFDAATGSVTLYPWWALTLNNDDSQAAANEKNADIISEAAESPISCTVTLADRTLWKDGDWNTLCLPFNLTIEGSVLDGDNVDVRTLSSTEFDSSTSELTLTFTNKGEVTELAAGTPYIIKWSKTNESDPDLTNLVNPVFTNVTISNATANISTDYISFVGTYSSVVFDAGTAHKDVLFLGGGSSLYYPDGTSATTINACRAYFTLNGITAGDPNDPNAVKAFVLNFGDDETTDSLTPNPSPVREGSAGAWYDISGRKVSPSHNTPSYGEGRGRLPRGIYIHNGRKVVIK